MKAYDRGRKFAHYRSCPTLVEYVLVASQRTPKVERFFKSNGAWVLDEDAGPGQEQRLSSLEVVLDVDELYRGLLDASGTIRVP